MIAGHFGLERTLEAVQRRMEWPSIVLDIKELCKSCPVCQRASRLWLPEPHYIPYP